jgi:hypothetical protein
MGHNFTLSSNVFTGGLGIFVYSEGIASAIAITAVETILNNPSQFELNSDARASLQYELDLYSNVWLDDFQDWYNSGAIFNSLNPNIISGMWLNFKDSGGSAFATKFFLPLDPQHESRLSPVLDGAQGVNGKHTFFAALVSAAMKEDQYSTFVNDYHFPIDQSFFNQAYQELFNILYDVDADGIESDYDNCPETPNGSDGGTCTEGSNAFIGEPCMNDTDCGDGGFCSMEQEDLFPPQGNNIGDACDCECDFDCSGGVDANDVTAFLGDFGRSTFNNPCTNTTPCNGDVDCNVNVDAGDIVMFLQDFGRSPFNNPCPTCVAGAWCVYP